MPPRPYETLGIPAITKKDTVGKSFPSRHAACGSVIALTALWAAPPLGYVLVVVSLLIALSRVLAGVHFIRDVLSGWLLGAIIGQFVSVPMPFEAEPLSFQSPSIKQKGLHKTNYLRLFCGIRTVRTSSSPSCVRSICAGIPADWSSRVS